MFKLIVIFGLVTHSMCVELTLPLSWNRDNTFSVSHDIIPVHDHNRYIQYVTLYTYENTRAPIDRISYKNILLYKNDDEISARRSRLVYHLIGDVYEVVIITLRREMGEIEGAYYIVDRKVYDVWILDAVLHSKLENTNDVCKQVVSTIVYSKLPNMTLIRTFDVESIREGSLVLMRNKIVNYQPNASIDPFINSVMDTVFLGEISDHN